MALRRVRLERSWCRLTRELADHSSRGIHRCDRIVFRNCLRQCHRGHDSVPFVSRGANASNATALGPELHDVGNCRPASIRLADRSKPFANKIASRRSGAGKRSAEPKIRSTIHSQNLRSIRALERDRAARKSGARSAALAGEFHARPCARREHRELSVRHGFFSINKNGLVAGYARCGRWT